MIHVFSSCIVHESKRRVFGSVLYDEFGNDDIKLNFFSAYVDFDKNLDEDERDQEEGRSNYS